MATAMLGLFAALRLPDLLLIDSRWGAAGLTASAGIAGWLEFALLRRSLGARIGAIGVPRELLGRLWMSAAAAAAIGWGVLLVVGSWPPILAAILVLGAFGIAYFGLARALGVSEARELLGRLVPTRPGSRD
jgi:putative peptidoglycan lipid II flippase